MTPCKGCFYLFYFGEGKSKALRNVFENQVEMSHHGILTPAGCSYRQQGASHCSKLSWLQSYRTESLISLELKRNHLFYSFNLFQTSLYVTASTKLSPVGQFLTAEESFWWFTRCFPAGYYSSSSYCNKHVKLNGLSFNQEFLTRFKRSY